MTAKIFFTNSLHGIIWTCICRQVQSPTLCRTLKATEEGSEKKTIVMTSVYKARKYADEAILYYHADAYITKPIDFPHLGVLLANFAPLAHGEAMAS